MHLLQEISDLLTEGRTMKKNFYYNDKKQYNSKPGNARVNNLNTRTVF